MPRFLARALVPLVAGALLASAAPAAFAAATDPATVFTTFLADVSAGNATGAAALLAPTVTWKSAPAQAYPPKFPLSASGVVQVGALLTQEQALHVTLKLTGTPTVSGNTVTWTAAMSNPTLTTLGVSSVAVDGTATVTNGLITAIDTTVAPASAAALAKAYGSSGASAALPSTGGSPLTWAWGVLLMLLGGGLALRPRARRRAF